ncbi:MAG: MBL fold metallo-hydrolase, partial [Alphaproteobacteria bacterium]
AAAIIDPVWDYDPAAGRLESRSARRLVEYVRAHDLSVAWILETHAHADHLTAARWLQKQLGGRIGIGARITTVQAHFYALFNWTDRFAANGEPFDRLFCEGDRFAIDDIPVRVMHTPGHTPACVTYVLGDDEAAFVGDTIFMPDYGTARTDFPGGDARTLYRSIRRILTELRPDTRLYMCHDYRPGGREARWETTVAEQRAHNVHVHDGIDEQTFVRLRQERDRSLAPPRLLYPSLQVNIRAGELPPAESNGRRYMKIPLTDADESGRRNG